MSSVFKITSRRKVYIANQNFFHIPIVHPSYTENCHIISYVIKGGWKLKIGDEIINAKKDCVFIQPANVPRTGLELCPADTNTVFVHFSAEEGDAYGANLEAAGDGFLTMPNFIDASENGEIKTLLMKIFEEKLKENEITADFADSVVDMVSGKGFDPIYGARPLRRTIQSEIEDLFAEKILDGTVKKGDNVTVEYVDGKIEFRKN